MHCRYCPKRELSVTHCLRRIIWKTAWERDEWLLADVTPEVRTVFPCWMSRITSATLTMTCSLSPTTCTCCFPSSNTRSFCFPFSRSNTCIHPAILPLTGIKNKPSQSIWIELIDQVKVLRPIRHKIGHFGDVLLSQSLGLVLKNKNKHNKSKHASVTKYTAT